MSIINYYIMNVALGIVVAQFKSYYQYYIYIYYNKLTKTIIYNFLRLIRLRIGFRAGVLGVRVGVCCVGLYIGFGCIIYISG